jgi:hypothetical protein
MVNWWRWGVLNALVGWTHPLVPGFYLSLFFFTSPPNGHKETKLIFFLRG